VSIDHVIVTSPTEDINPATELIDRVDSLAVLRMINAEDALVPAAVALLLPALSALVDEAIDRVRAGGRVHYFGAGTSGRLGVLDAAELLPTFGIDDDVVLAHQAGGPRAFVAAVENAEDDEASARLDAAGIGSGDVVLGLAASGRTPYVGAALTAARAVGARTALVTSAAGSGRSSAGGRHRPGGDCRVHQAQGRFRAEAGAQFVLDGTDGRTWPHIPQSHGGHAADECQAPRSQYRVAAGRHRGECD
jgi:D-arabinose 5-phosphate isomerase GutQ